MTTDRAAFAILAPMTALAIAAAAPASGFDFSILVDPEDGRPDASALLSRGGFVPVPLIITEPAVDGGFGIIGQFINSELGPNGKGARTTFGLARTGNGSTLGGGMRSGEGMGGAMRYSFGIGGADLTLPIFPFGLSQSVDYGNKMYGALATARFRLGQSHFWAGPRLTYRHTDISLSPSEDAGDLGNRVIARIDDLLEGKDYVSLGFSVNYDTRNNPVSPTDGINAFLRVDRFDGAFGSDADFTMATLAVTSFTEFGDDWSLGITTRYDVANGDSPFFFAPSVSLRGVQRGRYSGDSALSSEIELRRQLTNRWAGVVFGGYGESQAGDSRLYQSEDDIWTYGAGIRYRAARKLGIDVGLDVARGPEETTFYIQFGHAWARNMD